MHFLVETPKNEDVSVPNVVPVEARFPESKAYTASHDHHQEGAHSELKPSESSVRAFRGFRHVLVLPPSA